MGGSPPRRRRVIFQNLHAPTQHVSDTVQSHSLAFWATPLPASASPSMSSSTSSRVDERRRDAWYTDGTEAGQRAGIRISTFQLVAGRTHADLDLVRDQL